FSLLSDSWVRTINNIRGEKNANNSNRPILYSVNDVGSNTLNRVGLLNTHPLFGCGPLIQAGYFVIPKKLELCARYSWLRGESGDIRGNGTFTTLTPAQVASL